MSVPRLFFFKLHAKAVSWRKWSKILSNSWGGGWWPGVFGRF